MPIWLRRLSFILSILVFLIVAGCGTELEKPLSKEEISDIENVEKDVSRNVDDTETIEVKDEGESKSDQLVENETEASKNSVGNAGSSQSTVQQEEGKSEPSSSKTLSTNTVEKKTNDTKSETNSKNNSGSNSESTKNVNTQQSKGPESSSLISQSSNKDSNVKKQESIKNETAKKKESSTSESAKEKVEKPKSTSKSPSVPTAKPEEPKNTVVYSIVISNSEVPLAPTEVEIKDGDSVLDALIKVTRDKKIQMDYRGGQGATAYVEGIANVYEFDRGQGSGWMYRVNGVFPDRSAGIIPLYAGDRVEWLYTTDLGNDLGADLKPFRR